MSNFKICIDCTIPQHCYEWARCIKPGDVVRSDFPLSEGMPILVDAVRDGKPLPTFDADTKNDGDKAPIHQGCLNYFPRALEHIAIISAGGAKKYGWDGWDQVEDGINRYLDAEGRHTIEHNKGEVFDPDHSRYCSEPVRHLGQKAWNALAALELVLRENEDAKST